MGKWFGTDGVRGEANKLLTPQLALKIGEAASQFIINQKGDYYKTVVIGRDSRLSGQMLEASLAAALTSAGLNVILVGLIPTPGVAHIVRQYKAAAGVIISASHNPFNDNGIKFLNFEGKKLKDEDEAEIEYYMENPSLIKKAEASQIGRIMNDSEAIELYKKYLVSLSTLHSVPKKIVLDLANGAASRIGEELFNELGVEVIASANIPNGININANCGSTHIKNLQELVLRHNADAGFAFDGDADRFLAVNEKGKILDGDVLLAIYALWLQKQKKLSQDALVVTVMSNLGLKKLMNDSGIRVIETKVGDRYVNEAMTKESANLGGEQSGHIIFRDYNTTGDGLLSAIMLLNIMREKEISLSEISSCLTLYPQTLVNVSVERKSDWEKNEAIKTIIDEMSAKLGNEGRILVRASGTENLLRIMVEGKEKEQIEKIASNIAIVVARELNS